MKTNLALEISSDQTGFPLFRIEGNSTWLHWFPVTKLQFELFLADSSDAYFTAQVYEDICQCNRRESPQNLAPDNFWAGFVTGVLPREVEAFAQWLGPGYRVPSISEWRTIYESLKDALLEPEGWELKLPSGIPPRRALLIRTLDQIARVADSSILKASDSLRLVDQLFLRGGVVEWTRDVEDSSDWRGLGEPHPSFGGQLVSRNNPVEPQDAQGVRVPHFGFRLLRHEDLDR